MGDAQPGFFLFLGDKTVALLAGAIVAYLIGVKCMGKEKAEKAATDSLSSAGIVFLITGAGGAFSNIITITGVSDAIADIVSGFAQNVFVVLILSYLSSADQTGDRLRYRICAYQYDHYVRRGFRHHTATGVCGNGLFVRNTFRRNRKRQWFLDRNQYQRALHQGRHQNIYRIRNDGICLFPYFAVACSRRIYDNILR